MSKKILTPGNVQAILRMRAIQDDWGDPRYTGSDIAIELGVSESTVWRVIKQQAAYAKRVAPSQGETRVSLDAALEAVKGVEVPEEEIQSSIARLQADIHRQKAATVNASLDKMSEATRATAETYLGIKK